jgi:hypothetical protein
VNPPGTDSGPAWYDIPGQVQAAINGWLGNVAKAVLTPVLAMIGQGMLSTPNLTGGRIEQIWDITVGMADTCFVLLVVVGGLLVMGYETVQTRWAAKQISGRLLFAFLVANCSLILVRQLLALVNALTAAIFAQDVSPAGIGAQLTSAIIDSIFVSTGVANVFLVLLGLVVAALAVAVLCSFALRTASLLLLVVLAPLMLACHALPMLDAPARLWWRALGALFAIQILQATTLMLMIQIYFDPEADVFGVPTASGLTDLLISCALFMILLKIPGWARRAALGRGGGSGVVSTVFRTATFAAVGSAFGVGAAGSARGLASRVVGRSVARRIGPTSVATQRPARLGRAPRTAMSPNAPAARKDPYTMNPSREYAGGRDQIPGQLAAFPVPSGARVPTRKDEAPLPESVRSGEYPGQLPLFPRPVAGHGRQQPLFKVPKEWRSASEQRQARPASAPAPAPASRADGLRHSQPGLFSPKGELYQAPVKLTPGQAKQRRIEAARRRATDAARQRAAARLKPPTTPDGQAGGTP